MRWAQGGAPTQDGVRGATLCRRNKQAVLGQGYGGTEGEPLALGWGGQKRALGSEGG